MHSNRQEFVGLVAAPGNAGMERSMRIRANAMLALFAILMLPAAASVRFFHTDERHYSEAAIRMMRTGEYLIPEAIDGSLRVVKPILPYWSALLGMRGFGVSPLGLRIGSLTAAVLAGLALIRLARQTGPPQAAVYTVIFLAGAPLFARGAVNANPDMLLMAALTLAWVGAVQIITGVGNAASAWCFHLGIGLGMAAKGMLPLFFLAYALTACAVMRRDRLPAFVNPGAMLVGATIGLGWYIWSYAELGRPFLALFAEGQVASGSGIRSASAVRRFFGFNLHFAAWLLPFSILFMSRPVRHAWRADPQVRLAIALAMGWLAVNLCIFSLAPKVRTRYLLPALPGLAWAFGVAVARHEELLSKSIVRVIAHVIGAVWVVAGAVACFLLLALDLRWAAVGAAAGAAVVAGANELAHRRLSPLGVFSTAAGSIWIMFPFLLLAHAAALPRTAEEQILDGIARQGVTNETIYVLNHQGRVARLNLLSGARPYFRDLKCAQRQAGPDDPPLVLLTGTRTPELRLMDPVVCDVCLASPPGARVEKSGWKQGIRSALERKVEPGVIGLAACLTESVVDVGGNPPEWGTVAPATRAPAGMPQDTGSMPVQQCPR